MQQQTGPRKAKVSQHPQLVLGARPAAQQRPRGAAEHGRGHRKVRISRHVAAHHGAPELACRRRLTSRKCAEAGRREAARRGVSVMTLLGDAVVQFAELLANPTPHQTAA